MSDRGGADDDVTIWAGRLRAWPNPLPDEDRPSRDDEVGPVDDETVLARRRAALEPTVLAPRRSSLAPVETPGESDLPDDATAPGRRRRAAPDPEPDDDTAPGSRERSRTPEVPAARVRRSALRAAQGLPEERAARVPSADAREIYRPRPVVSEVAMRAAPTPRVAQESVDVAAASLSRTRRARRRALVVIAVGTAAGLLAVAAIVWSIVVPA